MSAEVGQPAMQEASQVRDYYFGYCSKYIFAKAFLL